MNVDFSYAFASPHRLTVCLPNSSHKILLDCRETNMRMVWTYEDPRPMPLATFMVPKPDVVPAGREWQHSALPTPLEYSWTQETG